MAGRCVTWLTRPARTAVDRILHGLGHWARYQALVAEVPSHDVGHRSHMAERETGTGTSLNGSLDVRLKYGYLQVNMDDWTIGGSMGWTKDAGFLIDLTIGPLHFWARTRRW